MTYFSARFTVSDLRELVKNLQAGAEPPANLSSQSLRILKTVHFSRQDIDRAVTQAAVQQAASD